jgi:hypothetical protein
MKLKPGLRLRSAMSNTEVVVVRGGTDVALTCGGVDMVGKDVAVTVAGGEGPEDTAIGKRYVDEVVGVELLCTKAGAGILACDGRPLALRTPKPLPSTD